MHAVNTAIIISPPLIGRSSTCQHSFFLPQRQNSVLPLRCFLVLLLRIRHQASIVSIIALTWNVDHHILVPWQTSTAMKEMNSWDSSLLHLWAAAITRLCSVPPLTLTPKQITWGYRYRPRRCYVHVHRLFPLSNFYTNMLYYMHGRR